jgi:DNA repair photolyase
LVSVSGSALGNRARPKKQSLRRPARIRNPMKLEFSEYRPRKIVNVHKHVDGPWFWSKYSAHPYIGCRSGCEFCYLRGGRYLGKRDPDSFDTLIQVKLNAPELLRKELSRLAPDVIVCGDWQQPAEDRYQLSRQMLQVVLELGFPLLVVERSPLLTRDIDLLAEINRDSWVGVVYSVSNMDPALKQAFEPRSPGLRRRFLAMQELAEADILVGTALMPIIPTAGDSKDHLEAVVLATRDHGGKFVLAGGLTMSGDQAARSLAAARRLDPEFEATWRRLYNWHPQGKPTYGPPQGYTVRLGNMVRGLCRQHGLHDRIPRYIPEGELGINKRIAERLFLRTYDLELAGASGTRIWAYRKAAWTADELDSSIAALFGAQGVEGLRALPAIGARIADEIVGWLDRETH